MTWQDIVLAVGSILFAAALWPMLLGERKPESSSSFSTAVVLWVFMVTYTSLQLYFASLTTALTAAEWTVLYFQAASR